MFSNNVQNYEDSTEVGEFLNQLLPKKKCKMLVFVKDNDSDSITNILNMNNDSDSDIESNKVIPLIASGIESNSIVMKKEMLNEAIEKSRKKQN